MECLNVPILYYSSKLFQIGRVGAIGKWLKYPLVIKLIPLETKIYLANYLKCNLWTINFNVNK